MLKMLMPKRTKYRKQHRLSYEGHAKGNTEINLVFHSFSSTFAASFVTKVLILYEEVCIRPQG